MAPSNQFDTTYCQHHLGIEHAFTFDQHFLVYRYGSNRHRAFRRHPA